MVAADPFSAAFGAIGGIAQAAFRDPGANAQSSPYSSVFDNSGWIVNTGSGKVATSASSLGALLQNPIALIVVAACIWLIVD